MPPITLTRETARLIHPLDTAIDVKATGEKALMAYASCDDLDVGNLVLKPDVEPTWYEVRALNDRESQTVDGLLGASVDADDSDRIMLQAEWIMQTIRVGLVSVDNLEGWDDDKRSKEFGIMVWDAELVSALGIAATFLFKAIRALTMGPIEDKKKSSGSSEDKPSGTSEVKEPKATETARDPLTVVTTPTKKTGGRAA